MFDIGFWELALIGAIALLVVGPERLPGLATVAGQWVGRARRFANHMRSEIQRELETEHLKGLMDEQKRELQSLRREVEGVRDETESAARDIKAEVRGEPKVHEPGVHEHEASVARDAGPDAREDTTIQAVSDASKRPASAEPGTPKSAAKKKSARKKPAAKKTAAKKTPARKKSAAKKKASARSTSSARQESTDDNQ